MYLAELSAMDRMDFILLFANLLPQMSFLLGETLSSQKSTTLNDLAYNIYHQIMYVNTIFFQILWPNTRGFCNPRSKHHTS
eukprot:c44911_g1_i1 orf=378-620(-)